MIEYQAAMSFGRDQYINYPDKWLTGCRQDSIDMRLYFQEVLGLNEDQCAVLWNKDCTKKLMKENLGFITESTSRLQRAFFSDSGHGTTVNDPSELDGLSGALCCYDLKELASGEYDPDTLFLESDLQEALARVPCLLECFIDACYAGEAAEQKVRGSFQARQKIKSIVPRSRFIVPVLHKVLQDRPIDNTVIWAACAPDQTSAEGYFDGKARGAFTYFFVRESRIAPDCPRGELLERVRVALKINGYSQVPQLSCSDKLMGLPVGDC